LALNGHVEASARMSALRGKADNQPARTMLEPDEWDSVLGSVTGTIYRGTERISSNALLNALGVPNDPSLIPARIFHVATHGDTPGRRYLHVRQSNG
jgi:hypothetical protein